MSHDIHKMAYAGATPWHGLGTKLPANATYDQVKEAAGFYEVGEVPIYANVGGDPVLVPDRKGIVRLDRKGRSAWLQTAGNGYQILQFEEMGRAVVEACGGTGSVIHTAGTLGENGARGWILAELPERFIVRVPGDESEVRPYVLAATGHDGTLAAHFRNVATRVVCQNTLGAALGERGGASWTIRHTKGAQDRLENAAKALATLGARMVRFGEMGAALARIRLEDADWERAVRAAIPIPDDGEKHPTLEGYREEIRAMREGFTGASKAIVGSAWGDFQAITEALDWKGRANGMTAADRTESSALGASALAKSRAFEVIVDAAGLSLAAVASR